jgi:DNA-directed RNA polymerase subunit E'/Rpb7
MELSKDENKSKKIGPYFNTRVVATIGLHPSQITPQININLKDNIIKKFENKCFKSYGLISKIYDIKKKDGGLIGQENALSPATFQVEFACKFCRPRKNELIVCEVKKINKQTVLLQNGPIHVYIIERSNQTNDQNFQFDKQENVLKGKVRVKLNDTEVDKYVKVLKGTFINIRCADIRIESGTRKIIVWGIMESVASKEERDRANIENETNDLPFTNYEDYIQSEALEDETMSEQHQDDEENDE